MNASITSGITDGQKVQYERVIDDATKRAKELVSKKVSADTDGWQRVIESGDELQNVIVDAIISKTLELSRTNQFAGEEVRSNYAYPKEYNGPKSIEEQIAKLLEHFPGLDSTQALALAKSLPELPDGAKGWFAVPRIEAVAKLFFPEITNPVECYCQAVNLVLEKIGDSRKFYNWRAGQITPDKFRMHARTTHALDLLAEKQPGDILLIPAQFGMRHRGKSVRRVREVISGPEFGLGSFIIGCMILTHPERLVRWEQLHIDCSGDEFSAGADGRFGSAPRFLFHGDRVEFGTDRVSSTNGDYGSVSGFLPQ